MTDKTQKSSTGGGSAAPSCSVDRLKVLDLFSGIGGFSLGLERAGMKTVAFCEIEEFPRKVLRKHWPDVPIFKDVRTLHYEDLPETVELICGGYPCQPFSVAGQQKGKADDRHLWPEMYRLIRECSPAWVIAENVDGHVRMGLDDVLSDLENEGYTCWTFIIPACSKGFPHRRNRVWIVANRNSSGFQKAGPEQQAAGLEQHRELERENTANTKMCGRNGEQVEIQGKNRKPAGEVGGCDCSYDVNTKHAGRKEQHLPPEPSKPRQYPGAFGGSGSFRGFTQSPVCRRDDGIPSRVDRIKGLGNAVVSQIPEIIGRAILEHAA